MSTFIKGITGRKSQQHVFPCDVEERPQPHGKRPTISFFLEINMAVITPQRNKRAVAEVPKQP